MASPDVLLRGLRVMLRTSLSPALHRLHQLRTAGTAPAQAIQLPEVAGLLSQGLQDGQQAAEESTEAAWRQSGAPMDSPTLQVLLRDTERIFSDAFWSAVQELGSSDVLPDNAEELAGSAAMHAGMAVSTALSAGTTEAVLAEGYRRRAAGEHVRKRWRSRKSATTCHWCWELDGTELELEGEFSHGAPAVLPRARLRHVRTHAGAHRYHRDVGAEIIHTRPPAVWRGVLLGPPRHPRCECWLELVDGDEPPTEPHDITGALMQQELVHSSDIQSMPEEQYSSMMTFLRAAVHELGQLLRRVARRG